MQKFDNQGIIQLAGSTIRPAQRSALLCRVLTIYEAGGGVMEKTTTQLPLRRLGIRKDDEYADRPLNKIEKSFALLQFRSAAIKPRINHLFELSSS